MRQIDSQIHEEFLPPTFTSLHIQQPLSPVRPANMAKSEFMRRSSELRHDDFIIVYTSNTHTIHVSVTRSYTNCRKSVS